MYKYMKMLAMAVFHSMKVWYVVSSITSGFVSKQNNTEPSPKLMNPIPHYQYKDPRTKRKWEKPLWLMSVFGPFKVKEETCIWEKIQKLEWLYSITNMQCIMLKKMCCYLCYKNRRQYTSGSNTPWIHCTTQTHKDTDLGRVEGHQWLRKLAPILATVTARSPVIKWLPPGSGT